MKKQKGNKSKGKNQESQLLSRAAIIIFFLPQVFPIPSSKYQSS
jgi:hypothetical protein